MSRLQLKSHRDIGVHDVLCPSESECFFTFLYTTERQRQTRGRPATVPRRSRHQSPLPQRSFSKGLNGKFSSDRWFWWPSLFGCCGSVAAWPSAAFSSSCVLRLATLARTTFSPWVFFYYSCMDENSWCFLAVAFFVLFSALCLFCSCLTNVAVFSNFFLTVFFAFLFPPHSWFFFNRWTEYSVQQNERESGPGRSSPGPDSHKKQCKYKSNSQEYF